MASQCWVPGRTTDAVRYCDDAGNATLIPVSLAILAAVLDRLGRYEPAATIAGFAVSPLTARPSHTANQQWSVAVVCLARVRASDAAISGGSVPTAGASSKRPGCLSW